MFPPLEINEIRLILAAAGFDENAEITKIPVGFSHDVYDVSGKYIVKFGKSEEEESRLKKEVYFSQLFREKLPVAPILFSDLAGRIIPRPFIIYKKVEGKTLYEMWHTLSEEQRKGAITAIANYLHSINETPYREYIELFNVDIKRTWFDTIVSRIEKNIRIAKNRKLLSLGEVELLDRYVLLEGDVLRVSRMALTYFDPHFDNFLVDDSGRIAAMLDFERTEFASVDYVLDLVRRMTNHPEKYASEQVKQFTQKEDYAPIWEWLKGEYPELFNFPDLEKRLNLYAIDHDLDDLLWYPEDKQVKENLLQMIQG